jgi:uncharacterized membrane protein YtjA (UPF0391 family)
MRHRLAAASYDLPLTAGKHRKCLELFGEFISNSAQGKSMFIVVSLLVIASIAAALGFSGLAGTAAGVAKLVFITAIIPLAVSVIVEGLRGSFSRR